MIRISKLKPRFLRNKAPPMIAMNPTTILDLDRDSAPSLQICQKILKFIKDSKENGL